MFPMGEQNVDGINHNSNAWCVSYILLFGEQSVSAQRIRDWSIWTHIFITRYQYMERSTPALHPKYADVK